jgi:hypothetical protein
MLRAACHGFDAMHSGHEQWHRGNNKASESQQFVFGNVLRWKQLCSEAAAHLMTFCTTCFILNDTDLLASNRRQRNGDENVIEYIGQTSSNLYESIVP